MLQIDLSQFDCPQLITSFATSLGLLINEFFFNVAMLRLSCGIQDLHCVMPALSLGHTGSLVVACGLSSGPSYLVAPWCVES